ncbi:hypothetical protein HPNQ4161_1270 [Helicobacter pylori NQ4161]|nr:hypothetical protein HPNQ4161_1270 [Helicobacter pylori NQ4161]
MASIAILVALSAAKVLSVIFVTHAVLRAFRFYENRNIFQLFLTSVKKNCIIIFL